MNTMLPEKKKKQEAKSMLKKTSKSLKFGPNSTTILTPVYIPVI